VLAGQLYGEIVSVEMETLPGCSIDASLSCTATYRDWTISCADSNATVFLLSTSNPIYLSMRVSCNKGYYDS
ncbi:MAG: hypothetical protein V3T59_04290, partial [Desulfobacterales bacterium]